MIFIVQFGINNLVQTFQRPQILLVFEKIYSCLFDPNQTLNHVITCTN